MGLSETENREVEMIPRTEILLYKDSRREIPGTNGDILLLPEPTSNPEDPLVSPRMCLVCEIS